MKRTEILPRRGRPLESLRVDELSLAARDIREAFDVDGDGELWGNTQRRRLATLCSHYGLAR